MNLYMYVYMYVYICMYIMYVCMCTVHLPGSRTDLDLDFMLVFML
jgi:hypothetical protein